VTPCNRRSKQEWFISKPPTDLVTGDIVILQGVPSKIIERLGHIDDPAMTSLIAIHEHQIPHIFPQEALDIAANGKIPSLKDREDLRDLPLVTIDGEDARDFDDAVWAEPDGENGWHAIVAIADVAHYVLPESALDTEAQRRGNSVYFPDRVVPMLPEHLSNGLCSLQPNVDRGCLVAHLWIDRSGRLKRYQFTRGLMRSAARLTYHQVENVLEGAEHTLRTQIMHLFAAYQALKRARIKRGALEIDGDEYKVVFNKSQEIEAIVRRTRLQSHQLIEELMILANVAAAHMLEAHQVPCMYRIHDRPDPVKIANLNEFMATLAPPSHAKNAQAVPVVNTHQKDFNKLLYTFANTPHRGAVTDVVLRCQSQARYSPHNVGHYGLNLPRYAHFTSPIRRYADLLVHRAILSVLQKKPFGYTFKELESVGDLISGTERRAVLAERDTMERYLCQYMAPQIGATFGGRISGVARFGVFVTLDEIGATGVLPIEALGRQKFHYDAAGQRLYSRQQSYTLGDTIVVQLETVNNANGKIQFVLPKPHVKPKRHHPHR
jgi:ribonuclease R